MIELRPQPTCTEPHHALRRLLKFALRVCALKCTSLEVRQPNRDSTVERPYDAAADLAKSIELGFEIVRERVRSGGKGWGEP